MEYLPNLVQLILTILLPNFWIIFLGFRLTFNQKWLEAISISFVGFTIGIIVTKLRCYNYLRDNFSTITSKPFVLTYTLGIPCIPEDIPKLFNLVENINKQTMLPNEVIIGLSETNNLKAKEIESRLNNISKYPIKINNIIEKAYAGINRNRIAKNSTCDYIIYMDADDLMHPQRIEIVNKVLKENNMPIGLLHGLSPSYSDAVIKDGMDKVIDLDKSKLWKGKQLYNYHIKHPINKTLHLPYLNLHHGHAIYKKELFNNIQFTNMRRGQDAQMVRDILNFYGNVDNNLHYIQVPLTLYTPRKIQNY